MAVKEARPVYCYKCGQVLATVETEWTQEGMARFREQAEAIKRDHVCSSGATDGAGQESVST